MRSEVRKDILMRLRCIEGHTRGVARMVEAEADCQALLRQVRALHGALDKITLLVVREHLDRCLLQAMESEDPADRERAVVLFNEVLSASRPG